MSGTSNTPQGAHTDNTDASIGAKLVRNFENAKESGEKVDGGMKLRLSGDGDSKDEMAARVEDLSKKLGTPVRIIRTDEEVSALPTPRQRKQKGSFNTMTGEVTIVVPSNANLADVENTFMHEVVGHDGLRVLFPTEERLNNALDELYRVSDDGIRRTIDRMAQRMIDTEAEKRRVEAIHHNANSDMEGRPNDEHHKESKAQKIANNSFARFFLAKVLFWGKFHENISIKKLRTLIKINKIA